MKLTRRTLMTAIPATGAALAAPQLTEADAPDPVVLHYRKWLDARREWNELAHLPGNGNFDDPRSFAAEAREDAAAEQMMKLAPTSLEGIGALAALAWDDVKPAAGDPEELEAMTQFTDCKAVLAIWRACTGKDGYPET